MSLQVNGNAGAVNWDALLGKLGEVTKTEGADGVAGSTNVTITQTVDGVETPVTIRIPDDLDIPETVDQAAIDSLCHRGADQVVPRHAQRDAHQDSRRDAEGQRAEQH